jgi:hypothetical protein
MLKRLWHLNPPLMFTAAVMILALAGAGVGLLVDPRQVTGAPVWLKPGKFAASFAIYAVTLTAIFGMLPTWRKTRAGVGWVTAVVMLLEFAIIALQAGRGTASHFNVSSALNLFLFAVMGIAIMIQTVTSGLLAVAVWREQFSDRALGWALRFGVTLSIVGALTGGFMTQPSQDDLTRLQAGERVARVGSHSVGGPDGGPGLPGTGWSVEHGDIRVAHFVGLHALQALPLFALALARRRVTDHVRVRMVVSAAASYATLFVMLLWQALRGQSVVSPDGFTLVAIGTWISLTSVALAIAIKGAGIVRPPVMQNVRLS